MSAAYSTQNMVNVSHPIVSEDSGTRSQSPAMYQSNPVYPIQNIPIFYNQTNQNSMQHPIQQHIPNGAVQALPTLLPPFNPSFSHSASNASSTSIGSSSALDMSPLPAGMFPMSPLLPMNPALSHGLPQMYNMAPMSAGQFIPMMQFQTPDGQTKGENTEEETLEGGSRASYPPSKSSNFPLMYPNLAIPQIPQYIPMMKVDTPDGPKLQPLMYYPPTTGMPGMNPYLGVPYHSDGEAAAAMKKNLKARTRTSSSRSFDGTSSEYSEEGKLTNLRTSSFKRHSSSISSRDGSSRDGYAETSRKGHRRTRSRPIIVGFSRSASSASSSDFADTYSRHNSVTDYYPDTDNSENENAEVESPATGNNIIGSPETLLTAFDSLISGQDSGPVSDDAGDNKKPKAEPQNNGVSGIDFLAAFQSSPKQVPNKFQPKEYRSRDSRSGSRPPSKNFLRDKKHTNSGRYNNKLGNKLSSDSGSYRGGDKNRPTSKERQDELFKTELCNAWINGQRCRFGKRCIFAHGQHELRAAQRKMDRQRHRPIFKKQLSGLLNRLTEANSSAITTELLCLCVEEIRDDEMCSMFAVKTIFTKACNDQKMMRLYSTIWQKLLNVHPMKKRMLRQMFELCLCEYAAAKNKYSGLGCMKWISELCRRNLFQGDIVYKILDDMFATEGKNEAHIEMWCTLIQSLKGCINTSKYFERLATFKSKFGSRVRFMIMDLEDLRSRNWVPST